MLKYKGIDSKGQVRVLEVSRALLPSSVVQTMDIEGKAGSYFLRKTHGVRSIEVEMAILGDSPEDLMDRAEQVADWLDSEKPEPLVFEDEPEKTYFAIVDGAVDLDEQLKNGFFSVSFLCPDPYAYGVEKQHNLNEGQNVVNYQGTAPVYPTIETTFSVAKNDFIISNGEDKVEIEFPFEAGTVLELDFHTGKVLVNGSLNLPIMTLDSDFFPLKKGDNTITVSSNSLVTYKERFK